MSTHANEKYNPAIAQPDAHRNISPTRRVAQLEVTLLVEMVRSYKRILSIRENQLIGLTNRLAQLETHVMTIENSTTGDATETFAAQDLVDENKELKKQLAELQEIAARANAKEKQWEVKYTGMLKRWLKAEAKLPEKQRSSFRR